MKRKIADKTFQADLFPAELEEVSNRRQAAGDQRELSSEQNSAEPDVDNDLIGLAYSGGGIRSASFCLGITQYLLKSGRFKHFDYLSTVSGGGYTGACISSLMSRGDSGERMLVDRHGIEEPLAVNHLRNGSNFLIPGGALNRWRMPSLYVIGLIQSLFLFLPIVILLVFLTELFFELTGALELPFSRFWLALAGIFPLLLLVFARPIGQLRRRSWKYRDGADRRAGFYLVFAILSVFIAPMLAGLEILVESDLGSVAREISEWLKHQLEPGIRSWLLWGVMLGAVALVVGLIKYPKSVGLILLAISGPLVLLLFYLVCCIHVINSTHISSITSADLVAAIDEFQDSGSAEKLKETIRQVLINKQHNPDHYEVDVESSRITNDGKVNIVMRRIEDETTRPWWYQFPALHMMTTRYQKKLTIVSHPWQKDDFVVPELSLSLGRTEWAVYLIAFLVWLFNYLVVNINRTSLNPFYRDRLSRTFLIRSEDGELVGADDLLLSELKGENSSAPYHLINTALNLQGTRDPQLRQRKTVPFVLSKRFCGSEYTGYCHTDEMEAVDRNLNLGTAMAVSAAAAGPSMGVKTIRSLSFVMTLLNIRLSYWMPNPAWVGKSKWWHWFLHRNPGLKCQNAEALGAPNHRGRFVNCSDGGHIENLGVYELLRRRCKTIVCVDAGGDPKFKFYDLTTLQRFARIDLGVKIDIDPEPLIPNENGLSQRQYVVGRILYPNGQQGTIIYLKLSYSGSEPEYLRFYKRNVSAFPHESTADQFFDETKFEVYRALGYFIADEAFSDPEVLKCFPDSDCPAE